MEYDRKQFFKEHEHDEVNGFTIMAAEGGGYHIAEKWESMPEESSSSGERWMDYWIPESDLLPRVESEKCEPHAELTDEQFAGVCKMVDETKYIKQEA